MITGQRCAAEIVVEGVRIEVVVEIIFVASAMPGIRAALGDYLNLRTGGAIKVGGLVGGIDLELFNAIERRWHDASGAAADLIGNNAACWIASKAYRVGGHTAVHVVGVLTTIKHERALVNDCAGNATIGGNSGLQGHEGGCVATDGRQILKEFTADGVADRGVQGLQFHATSGHFHGFRDRAELYFDVDGGGESDLHRLFGNLGHAEAGLVNRNVVNRRIYIDEDIPARVIGRGSA